MIMKNAIHLFIISVISVSISACTQLGVNMGAPVLSRLVTKIGDSKNYKLFRDGIAGNLLMATAITELSPDNIRLLKECSYMYFTLGLVVEDSDLSYAKDIYLIGKSYGMRTLKTNRKFRKGREAGEPVHTLVKHLGAKYAPALCWTSLNAGMWVLLNLDDPGALMEMADITAMAKRSVKLDPTYFHGVAKTFLGCYYAMVPKALDPDCGPDNAKKMFDQARSVDKGKMLLHNFFEARFLATNINDKVLFTRLLETILTSDSGALKGGYMLNELAKAKARHYLKNRESFF